MGKALIIENVGAGLYRAKILYDLVKLKATIAALQNANAAYWRDLLAALKEKEALAADVSAAEETLNAIIKQWKERLQQEQQAAPTQPEPPALPPGFDPSGIDPATGQPYTDEERAAALSAHTANQLNGRRAAAGESALTPSTTLNQSLSAWSAEQVGGGAFDAQRSAGESLNGLAALSNFDDSGRFFSQRLIQTTPGVVLNSADAFYAAGQRTADEALDAIMRHPDARNALLSADAREVGASYTYAPQNAAAHVWRVATANPRPAPAENADFFAAGAGLDFKDAVSNKLGSTVADGLSNGADGGSGGGGSGGGDWAGPWQSNTYFGEGAKIQSTRKNQTMVLAQAQNSGYSGSTEPLWPGPGMGVHDNQILWIVLSDIPSTSGGAVIDYYKAIGLI